MSKVDYDKAFSLYDDEAASMYLYLDKERGVRKTRRAIVFVDYDATDTMIGVEFPDVFRPKIVEPPVEIAKVIPPKASGTKPLIVPTGTTPLPTKVVVNLPSKMVTEVKDVCARDGKFFTRWLMDAIYLKLLLDERRRAGGRVLTIPANYDGGLMDELISP